MLHANTYFIYFDYFDLICLLVDPTGYLSKNESLHKIIKRK